MGDAYVLILLRQVLPLQMVCEYDVQARLWHIVVVQGGQATKFGMAFANCLTTEQKTFQRCGEGWGRGKRYTGKMCKLQECVGRQQ